MLRLCVHVSRDISEHLQLVAQSVFLVLNVRPIKLVLIKSVMIHVRAHVVLMQIAESITIVPFALVKMAMLVIHLLVVIQGLVSFNSQRQQHLDSQKELDFLISTINSPFSLTATKRRTERSLYPFAVWPKCSMQKYKWISIMFLFIEFHRLATKL